MGSDPGKLPCREAIDQQMASRGRGRPGKYQRDLEAALQRNGRFEVSKAMNREDALSLYRQINPDVAILDIMMPRVHGLKVCQMLKKDPQTSWIQVIMLSALGRQYTKNEAASTARMPT